MKQADGSDVAVLVVKSLTIPNSTALELRGGLPLAVVAEQGILVQGAVMGRGSKGYAGGGAPTSTGMGAGAGGGRGGAGGSFCGTGGESVRESSAPGRTYGSETLQPLVGGSAGGGQFSGGGGGALQLIAGAKIQVALTGTLNLGGSGGSSGGGGGGSGGALLLEAPAIVIDGVIAANGGGGSGSDGGGGEPGQASSLPAAGGNHVAGKGAAGESLDGEAGTATYGGGGGGAGRIRINTATGKVTLGPDAIISPALTTPCATEGTLAD